MAYNRQDQYKPIWKAMDRLSLTMHMRQKHTKEDLDGKYLSCVSCTLLTYRLSRTNDATI